MKLLVVLVVAFFVISCNKNEKPKITEEDLKKVEVKEVKKEEVKVEKKTEEVKVEKKEEQQGKEVNLDEKSWEKLNIFFCNFSESAVPYFEKDKLSDDELIKFGIRHNLINMPKNIQKVNENENYTEKVSAENVHNAIKKYFGKDFTNDKTVVAFNEDNMKADFMFKDNFYFIPKELPVQIDPIRNPTGETMKVAQVENMYQNSETEFTVNLSIYSIYPDAYSESIENKKIYKLKSEFWGKEAPEVFAKAKAKIKKTENEKYILIEYTEDK